MKKAVIFDIDGVLAEKSPERDYREYDKVHLDKHNKKYFSLLIDYATSYSPKKGSWKYNYEVIIITGRKEYCRELTEKWLGNGFCNAHENEPIYFYMENCKLFMRSNNDHRKAHILKKEIYETHIEGKYDVIACYDDDPEIIKMYQEKGLMTFLVGNRK